MSHINAARLGEADPFPGCRSAGKRANPRGRRQGQLDLWSAASARARPLSIPLAGGGSHPICWPPDGVTERFKREGPRPIVYHPTDANELAEATAGAEMLVK